jgi:hypothetical protein
LKPEGKKSINMDAETHKLIRIEGAETDTELNVLVKRAWEAYTREKLRRAPLTGEEDLIQRLLRFWYEPKGLEKGVRSLVSIAIELPEPPAKEGDDGE